MKTLTLRKISIMLAAFLAVGQLAACGSSASSDNTGADTSSDITSVTEPELTGRAAVKDNLPDADYNGATFNILGRLAFEYELDSSEENGDTLNDAVYRRNRKVEDCYNVEVEATYIDSDGFNNQLRSSVLADTGAYDLVAGYAYMVPALILDDLFFNWYDVEHVNLSQPWWSKQVADELTINNICYTISGDLTVSLWNYFLVYLFNKQLAEEYQTGDIYEIVRSGNWTLDKLGELTANTFRDLDGDTKQTWSDAYGLMHVDTTPIDAYLDAFQVPVITKNSEGIPEYTIDSEKTTDVMTRLVKLFYEDGNCYVKGYFGSDNPKVIDAFKEGRALFIANPMNNVVGLRDMEDDFGIIPYPKLDADQDSYYSTAMDNFSYLLMPIDVKDSDMAGMVTEALAAESYRSVVPAFYDVVLKTKVSRDDDSAEMLDIIRDGVIFNMGYSYSYILNDAGHAFQYKLKAKQTTLSTSWSSGAHIYENKLSALLTHYGIE